MASYDPSEHGDMDIIFVGGGATACVTAGRLAKANPDFKILIIEGGRNNFNDPLITIPANYMKNLDPSAGTVAFYKAQPSAFLNDREIIVPTGAVLGGGTSVNFQLYMRSQGLDWDKFDMPGWTGKDMIPLINKLETFHPNDEGIDQSMHGHDGPIHVSDGGFRGIEGEEGYREAVKSLGYNIVPDIQDFKTVGSFAKWYRYVSPEGKRSDAAHGYIHPLLQDGRHPNLRLLLNTKVSRVLFDNSSLPRAVGVEYTSSTPTSSTFHTIKANKLVIVSAGALGTPQILERSGVGSAELLSKLNIPVISDLPGVGENYQDHTRIMYPYFSSLRPDQTLEKLYRGTAEEFAKAVEEKNPMLGWNGIDFGAKLIIPDDAAKALGPAFFEAYKKDFPSTEPARHILLMGLINGIMAPPPGLPLDRQYMAMGTFTAYPWSRGSIHISSLDLADGNNYIFDPGFMSHEGDLKLHVWSYKVQREILRRLPYFRGELPPGHPSFPAGSAAALTVFDDSVSSKSLEPIQYSAEDDAAIEEFVRNNVESIWHSLGTAAMKPREKGGVVDPKLNVFGTEGLKVADLSIIPENVGGNTGNTAMGVGEKAAMIVAEELGLNI